MPEDNRKTFSHKYDIDDHLEGKKQANLLDITMDVYCNDAIKEQNNKYTNKPPSVLKHNAIKFKELIGENQGLKEKLSEKEYELEECKKSVKSWQEAYYNKTKEQFKEI